jgi:FKBP-type peptidyl-prolyl cis-trans isomerase
MKKVLLIIIILSLVNLLNAQTKPGTIKPVAGKPVSILKTMNDSASYAVGLSVANFYKQQGVTQLHSTLVVRGINDILTGKKPLCDDETATIVMNRYMSGTTKQEKINPNANKSISILKTINDSASYVVGMSIANFYKQQGITKLDAIIVSKAINDKMTGKTPLCNDETANIIMNRYISKIQEEKSKPAIEAGQKFLAKNKLRPEVKTTASGLQYEIITEGTGARPVAIDSVTCHYKGTLLNGTVFDDSYSRGQPITFALNGVIRGWTEGLQLMSTGSKYKFYIPYTLGYGVFDYGSIPGGSMLTFEVELLDVKKTH